MLETFEKIILGGNHMERKYPNLSRPITLGRTTFRNRMFSAPMCGTDITNDGCIGPKSTAFYELRAKGGAGAVTVSELMVHPKTDGSHAYHLDESILNSLAAATYTADAIRRHGAMPSLELSHSGMYAAPFIRVIGDAAKVSTITNAVYWGYHAALDIC